MKVKSQAHLLEDSTCARQNSEGWGDLQQANTGQRLFQRRNHVKRRREGWGERDIEQWHRLYSCGSAK
jgi:hypothetical protein